ncbi:hypothetical protein [Chryseobacterium oncorhynchi]|uniref:Uncharacterized protein n=1 Tax=Chryseobacterium oncorhynchi TaxID=741074 RepID=A0A316WF21_9FLAO|nr:hypothetical protein [Chryseobacterium oncorhynchi]PWN60011.1 hypothetical protein C1638_020815 [Chryseobacterium oncorhynchi]
MEIIYKLSPLIELPEYIEEEAIKYWFTNQKIGQLIKVLFEEREFNLGEMFDFTNLNSKDVNDSYGAHPFLRDISSDFENILSITRKTYSAQTYKTGGNIPIVTYELDFPNY